MKQTNILYVEDDPDIAEIYSTMIKENYENVNLVHIDDGKKAIDEIKTNMEKYQLIISDFQLPTITGGDIFKFVNGQMLGIPYIILSGFDCTSQDEFKGFFNSHVRNAVLIKPVSMEVLIEKMQWCLSSETNLTKIYSKDAKSCDERVPISSDVFMKLNMVPCDIYLKLGDGKFVKVINKNEVFESSLIKKLILKGVLHFYVNRSELSKYSNSVVSTLSSIIKVRKFKKGNEIQKSQLNSKAINVLKSNLLKCGFSEALLEATDELVNLQLELVKSAKGLEDFIEKFQLFKKSSSDHSRIVNYVMVAILRDLTWDSESTLNKMSLAALFHDATLPENFFKNQLSNEEVSQLSKEEQDIYFHHPEESSHLAKNFDKINSGIEQVILEHHELPDGKGFPKKLTYNHIHPMSAVLHLSDYVANLLINNDYDMNKVNELITKNKFYYLRGFYRKPYEAIMRIFKGEI